MSDAQRRGGEIDALTDDRLADDQRNGAGLVDPDETTMERPAAFDDPVPAGGRPGVVGGPQDRDVEAHVMRRLSHDTALEFDSLTVRRLEDGVLVEGVVRGVDGRPEADDLTELVRQLAEVDRVENRLLIRS